MVAPLQQQQYQKNPFYYSLLLHIIILTVLIINFDFSAIMPVMQKSDKDISVISATVMDMPLLSKKILQQPIPPKPIAPPHPKPVEPIKPIKNVSRALVRNTAIAIPDKKQQKVKENLLQKQLLADLKKQSEQQKKVKQKAIQAAFEKEMKELKAQSLQQQMLQEQRRIMGVHAQQMRGEVDKYKALILQTISQHWLIPNNTNKKLFAELFIRIAPGGVVLDVQLVKSSGNDALDRSARAAVLKASPLPVPTDADAFASFRQFVLKVKPENVLTNDSWLQ